MKLIFTPIAQEHWEYWKKNDPNITKRIKKLLADILEHPYSGIASPNLSNMNWQVNGQDELIQSIDLFILCIMI